MGGARTPQRASPPHLRGRPRLPTAASGNPGMTSEMVGDAIQRAGEASGASKVALGDRLRRRYCAAS
eukprot:9410777-Pyramimonas_sp.AAC.1